MNSVKLHPSWIKEKTFSHFSDLHGKLTDTCRKAFCPKLLTFKEVAYFVMFPEMLRGPVESNCLFLLRAWFSGAGWLGKARQREQHKRHLAGFIHGPPLITHAISTILPSVCMSSRCLRCGQDRRATFLKAETRPCNCKQSSAGICLGHSRRAKDERSGTSRFGFRTH
jgi:hypothetical protein